MDSKCIEEPGLPEKSFLLRWPSGGKREEANSSKGERICEEEEAGKRRTEGVSEVDASFKDTSWMLKLGKVLVLNSVNLEEGRNGKKEKRKKRKNGKKKKKRQDRTQRSFGARWKIVAAWFEEFC